MAITGMFYPRLSWNSGGSTFDFSEPALTILPDPAVLAGANVADDGTREQLTIRTEYMLRLIAQKVSAAEMASLWTWWDTWAKLGKQTAVTLDRLATASANWEYTQWNAYFDKAELLNKPFDPNNRMVLTRALYRVDLLFRQGK